jgi:hypothetical protein
MCLPVYCTSPLSVCLCVRIGWIARARRRRFRPGSAVRTKPLGGEREIVRLWPLARQTAPRRPSEIGTSPGRPGSPITRLPAEEGPCRWPFPTPTAVFGGKLRATSATCPAAHPDPGGSPGFRLWSAKPHAGGHPAPGACMDGLEVHFPAFRPREALVDAFPGARGGVGASHDSPRRFPCRRGLHAGAWSRAWGKVTTATRPPLPPPHSNSSC